jgi:hypothetical protein
VGNIIQILVNGDTEAGEHKVYFDSSDLAKGIYYYQLRVDGMVETRKMVVCD